MTPVSDYLRWEVEHAAREFESALAGLDAEESSRGARDDWRRYRYGYGLDGSIAGITTHVTAWKFCIAECLERGESGPVEAHAPPAGGWDTLVRWNRAASERVAVAVESLLDSNLAREVTLAGEQLPLRVVVSILARHDSYHAGQINLLRQSWGHTLDD